MDFNLIICDKDSYIGNFVRRPRTELSWRSRATNIDDDNNITSTKMCNNMTSKNCGFEKFQINLNVTFIFDHLVRVAPSLRFRSIAPSLRFRSIDPLQFRSIAPSLRFRSVDPTPRSRDGDAAVRGSDILKS